MPFSLRKDILNKDVSFGRSIDNKVISPLDVQSQPFNCLPHDPNACLCVDPAYYIQVSRSSPQYSVYPDLTSSAPHVACDDAHAQESLRALQQSADALPNSYLKTRVKSAVSGVLALWQTAKVEQSVGFLRRCMFYQIL